MLAHEWRPKKRIGLKFVEYILTVLSLEANISEYLTLLYKQDELDDYQKILIEFEVCKIWRAIFNLSVVKPKPKQSKYPITTNVNNETNQWDQWELKENAP